jgi:hypothetical protein|tara:strand:+ start:377 stop:556 length:180 start_codon:yes stop_codon:yes gene_type:complete
MDRSPVVAWPEKRICTGCKKVFNREECIIDIGDFWNSREDMVFACSKNCAENAKKNWLK